jgi:hypothetical protein
MRCLRTPGVRYTAARLGHPGEEEGLPYACRVVVLADEVKLTHHGRLRVPRLITAGTLAVTAIVLAWLGWTLLSPGGSLVIPTLIVFGVGCAISITYWIVTGSGAAAVALIVITVAASVWTFAIALPVAVVLDPSADSQANAAFTQLAASPRSQYGIPMHPCSAKLAGSVGPLDAPYRICAVSSPEGHFVLFTALGQTARGLGFTDRGAATFPDECSRHLTGAWWMFTGTTSGTGDCPIGYQFHGGG